MKKKWFFGIAFAFLLLQLIACTKSFKEDQLLRSREPLQAVNLISAPIPTCRIDRITSWSAYDTPEIIKFTYNLKGSPTFGQRNHSGTGSPHLLFYYDKKNRLTDYIGPYQDDPNSAYEFWFHYTYDQTGERVLIDTQYNFGMMVNGVPQPNPAYKSAGNYTYDAQGRIASVTRTQILQSGPPYPSFTDSYVYDTKGNLEGFGPYDNRTNFYQTNKVWQFVARNYSVNNPAWAEKYNINGYPLRFRTQAPASFSFLNQLDLHDSEITYQCQ